MSFIHLWGVKQNNLKDIEVKIPLKSFTVVCGPSGSGKSSLAFETLYAEGQRRYIESLSNYSKQFLQKAPKPLIEGIQNIPPAIALEQKNSIKNSRSTVGTTTETADLLRLLFEKIGKVFCPNHPDEILRRFDPVDGAREIVRMFNEQRGYVLCPVEKTNRVLDGKKLREFLIKEGFTRIYVSGQVAELSDKEFAQSGVPKQDFYIVIDRLKFAKEDESRLADSLRQAYEASRKVALDRGTAIAKVATVTGEEILLSESMACTKCGFSFAPLTPQMFSFNSAAGACSTCNGFGNILTIDENKVVPNPELTLKEGALHPFTMPSAKGDRAELNKYCKKAGIDVHVKWKDLPEEHKQALWNGNKEFFGIKGLFDYLETKKYKMHVRVFLSRFKSGVTCPDCRGTRLKPEALQVKIGGATIADLCALTIKDLMQTLKSLELSPMEAEIVEEVLTQLKSRLGFLIDVGVDYLTLERLTRTLSGGEFQRLMLANQLGLCLSQTLYVLDEPTVGLHPRDNSRLISILQGLKDLGNTLVVVEHDEDVIRSSSHILEMGPGSGHLGGKIVYEGKTLEFLESRHSLTAQFLRGEKEDLFSEEKKLGTAKEAKENERLDSKQTSHLIELKNCSGNNLKNLDLKIPLRRLVTITGVSGSGKSSLITQTLYPAIARRLDQEFLVSLPFGSLKGNLSELSSILLIDQSPVGKTARSNPATFMKIFDTIRLFMACTPEARSHGYGPGTFSLNVEGGRCPVCKGVGFETIDMLFMDDILIPCDSCDGKKFRDEVLEVRYKSKNVHEILNLTVEEALEFFSDAPMIRKPLSLLKQMGLEYLQLGQPANSLSGGESQRLKIAKELSASSYKETLYILDEPTKGLHFREVGLLMRVLHQLVEGGASVVVIEHNLDVIAHSDYVIDLGPESGPQGGMIVDEGAPREIAKRKKGHTGSYLSQYFERRQGSNKGNSVREAPLV